MCTKRKDIEIGTIWKRFTSYHIPEISLIKGEKQLITTQKVLFQDRLHQKKELVWKKKVITYPLYVLKLI